MARLPYFWTKIEYFQHSNVKEAYQKLQQGAKKFKTYRTTSNLMNFTHWPHLLSRFQQVMMCWKYQQPVADIGGLSQQGVKVADN